MHYIPIEIVSVILCWLPVEPLLRFRSVCKTWKELIDSPTFIKLHLVSHQSLKLRSANEDAKVILYYARSSFYSISFDSTNTSSIRNTLVAAHSKEIYCPLTMRNNVRIMGNCNGLLYFISLGLDRFLWNPSTRKYKNLRYFETFKIEMKEQRCLEYIDGFGYDESTDDYKVVIIMQAYSDTNHDSIRGETVVYSLKSNSWRKIKEFPHRVVCNTGGIFALGALHWLIAYNDADATGNNKYAFVALDIVTEEYELVPLPFQTGRCRLSFGPLNGCLFMSAYDKSDRVDIWMMKERRRGNNYKECWTCLFSVWLDRENFPEKYVVPITYSRSGKHVLLEKDRKQLLWYNLEENSVQKVCIVPGPDTYTSVVPCIESLVQLSGGGGVDEVDEQTSEVEEKNKKTKKRTMSNFYGMVWKRSQLKRFGLFLVLVLLIFSIWEAFFNSMVIMGRTRFN